MQKTNSNIKRHGYHNYQEKSTTMHMMGKIIYTEDNKD